MQLAMKIFATLLQKLKGNAVKQRKELYIFLYYNFKNNLITYNSMLHFHIRFWESATNANSLFPALLNPYTLHIHSLFCFLSLIKLNHCSLHLIQVLEEFIECLCLVISIILSSEHSHIQFSCYWEFIESY